MMANDIHNGKWIDIEEDADYSGVKPGTVGDWIQKEKGVRLIKLKSSGSLNALNRMPGFRVLKA